MAELNSCFNTVFDFKKKLECEHMVKKNVFYDTKSNKKIGKQCFMCEKCLKIFEPKQLKRVAVNVYAVKSE